jgi:hypothetical protein
MTRPTHRERILEMREIERLVGHLLDQARFARRDLADDGGEDRMAPVRDAGHLHRHVEGFERNVTVALPERRLGLELVGIDQPLDDDLGAGRHVEINGHAFGDRHTAAGERTGDADLVEVGGELLGAGEHHDRSGADHDGDRHRPLALLVLLPMQKAAGPAGARHHAHDEPVGGLERRPVGADVLDARLRILGDAERRGQIGRGIEARRRDRHREQLHAAVRRPQRIAGDDHVLAWRRRHPHRCDRICDGGKPGGADLADRAPHAERIDLRRRRDGADHDRDVVAPAGRIHHIGEQESAPLTLRNAADELQAHQGMQLGVLVDRVIDPQQEALGLEVRQMLLQVEPRPGVRGIPARRRHHIIHAGSS